MSLTADIPSDARIFGGELGIQIHSTPLGTLIECHAHIPGQAFDWGKSKKTLANLITDNPR